MKLIKYIFAFLVLCNTSVYSQTDSLLTKTEAVKLVLENNYGVIVATNNIDIASNNASIYNSGYLPTVNANAGANYSVTDTENTNHNDSKITINNAERNYYNASVGLNYTLFDGFGRKYNYQRLKETENLSELEAKTVIENALLQLFNIYYEVAQLTENNKNIAQSLAISKNRLQRAQYAYNYGQQTKLDVLNAEVDYNNDSIKYLNTTQLLKNTKRTLNYLLGRNATINFEVNTAILGYRDFDINQLLNQAKVYNTEILTVAKNIELSEYQIKINQANYYPKVAFNTFYNYNKFNNDNSYPYAAQLNKGLNAGLSLNWNIFDGGFTKTKIANAKINNLNLQILKNQIEHEIETDVLNAYEVYKNALFVLQAEQQNVATSEINFNRSQEYFKLGQINSIEFRQAQLNLLNAKTNLNAAKYNAKIAELRILQLTGQLLTIDF